MPAPKATESRIKRSISAWLACGLTIGSIEVYPDGTIRVLAPSEGKGLSKSEENSCDDLFETGFD